MIKCHQMFRNLNNSRNFTNHVKKTISPIKMSYKIFNADQNKTPMIIMHGLLGSKMNWSRIAKDLQEKNRKVITVDARNHGESPHSQEMSYRHLAEDIHELIRELGLIKATCIGHSMGGRAMMTFAINYPQLVDRLIVVDISPFASQALSDIPGFIDALLEVKLKSGIPMGEMRKSAFEQLGKHIESHDTRQFLLTNLVERGGSFKWKANLEALKKNINEITQFEIPKNKIFQGPTLFLAGQQSDFLNRSMHPKIMEIFPKAQFQYVKDAGHNVHYDKPTEFVKHILDFIDN